jgi:pimeloyl-ACP methyl ester carboxylesterase
MKLFILPGLLEDADAFAPVIELLGDAAACTVADLTRADSIAQMATHALEQAPEGAFSLAGHSMGGYVALEIMRIAPERVVRLALLNTNARPDSPESTENRRRLMALAESDLNAVVAALLPKQMTAEHLKNAELTDTIGAMALAVGRDAFARQQRANIGRIDSRPFLADIHCPTLVVAGRDDAIMPLEVLRELADGIPGARLAIIEECGHMAPLENPEELAALLREWLVG